jgi:methionyl-tRNA synthetase
MDIRIGRVIKAIKHPKAKTLYVEDIDIGEESTLQVVSNLQNYVPLDKMQVLCIGNRRLFPSNGLSCWYET